MPNKLDIYMPTPEEDAEITAAALSDPDAQPLTDEELAQFTPIRLSELAALNGVKLPVRIDVDVAVIDVFKNAGPDWQDRMSDVLAEWASAQTLL